MCPRKRVNSIGDNVIAAALLDRLLRHAIVIEIDAQAAGCPSTRT